MQPVALRARPSTYWHSMGFSQVRTASPAGHACGVHGPPLSHSAFVLHAWYRCAPVMHVGMQVAKIPCVVNWMQQTLPPWQSAFSSHCWTAPLKQNEPLASDPHVCVDASFWILSQHA